MGWYVDTPPLPCDRPWRTHRTLTNGHGRLQDRCLHCRDDLDGYLTWPGVQQVLQRVGARGVLRTCSVTHATRYALTSVSAADAAAAVLAQWWRAHWVIENRVHYVRDVTLGEDAHHLSTGSAAQALAVLRNTLLNVVRAAGWTNIAAARRHHNASVDAARAGIGIPTCGLI